MKAYAEEAYKEKTSKCIDIIEQSLQEKEKQEKVLTSLKKLKEQKNNGDIKFYIEIHSNALAENEDCRIIKEWLDE